MVQSFNARPLRWQHSLVIQPYPLTLPTPTTLPFSYFRRAAFLFLLPLSAAAQDDTELPGLLTERQRLTTQYATANAQRHSLFGNKPSKKDLQEVVDALQGIVDKDQQIVDVLNRTARAAQTAAQHYSTTASTLETTSRGDRNLTAQRLSEVENELANARQREKKLLADQRDQTAEVAEAQQGRFVRDALIATLAVVCAGLLVAWRRRK